MAIQKFSKEQLIIAQGQASTGLSLIMSGSVYLIIGDLKIILHSGDIIGICEIGMPTHQFSYQAFENTALIAYPCVSIEDLHVILNGKKELCTLFARSAVYQTRELLRNYHHICLRGRLLYEELKEDYSVSSIPESFEPDSHLLPYYQSLSHVLTATLSDSFAQNPWFLVMTIQKAGQDLCHYGKNFTSIYEEYYASMQSINIEILTEIDRMAQLEEDRQNALLSKHDDLTMDISNILKDSLSQILQFAGWNGKSSIDIRRLIGELYSLPDQNAEDDKSIHIRQELTILFNSLYKDVVKVCLANIPSGTSKEEITAEALEIPEVVRMFLYYGYLDEQLAGMENSVHMYHLCQVPTPSGSNSVYYFFDWLLAIYQGLKEPSRDEFDADYTDTINKKKASKLISDAEAKDLLENTTLKMEYELENMFPTVNKMSSGRITSYCPVFSEQNINKSLFSSLITPEQCTQILMDIDDTDCHAFYKEVFFLDSDMDNAAKEIIHVKKLPDIILMPNLGSRGVMWQEIEGKRRNTPARYIFSIFLQEDLQKILLRLTAEYRWEMCKRIQGARWNDVTDPSLTSSYFDYVQFYRKNNDLTTDAKEKIKSTLQKYHNNFKEMFINDYQQWVLFEGNGSPRLNKVARGILFTYCPFGESIRTPLAQNPMYKDYIERFTLKQQQRLHHLDLLERKYFNSGKPLPDELLEERSFTLL